MIDFLFDIYEKCGIVFFPLFFSGLLGWFYLLNVFFLVTKKNIEEILLKFEKKISPQDNQQQKEIKTEHFILENIQTYIRQLNTVKALAGVAPLLGLLGTVNGMIQTFNVISLFGSGNAVLMADGISEALITTQTGLAIAFSLLLFHTLINNRVKKLIKEVRVSVS